jgi:hypothetical protein
MGSFRFLKFLLGFYLPFIGKSKIDRGSKDMEIVSAVKVGFQVYVEEGGEECGAVREVAPQGRAEIVVYIENAGDFAVPAAAIRSAHDAKVVLNPALLDQDLLDAIAHAHDREAPGF